MIEFTNDELQERIEKLQAHIKELVSEQTAYVRKLKGEIRMLHIRVKEANRGVRNAHATYAVISIKNNELRAQVRKMEKQINTLTQWEHP